MVYNVYFSATGRTRRVAETLAAAWGETVTAVDLSDPTGGETAPAFAAGDLCLVTVPVYGGRVPRPAAERLRAFSGNGADAVLTAVYGGRAVDDCLLELEDLLTGAGFRCRAAIEAVAEHSIMPAYASGRPDAADRVELAGFAVRIKEDLGAGMLPETVAVPGKRPYAGTGGMPVHPKGNKACIRCGACAAACPVGAIPAADPTATDKEKCITCMRCVELCPAHARTFPAPLQKVITWAMKKQFAGARENKLYLK